MTSFESGEKYLYYHTNHFMVWVKNAIPSGSEVGDMFALCMAVSTVLSEDTEL